MYSPPCNTRPQHAACSDGVMLWFISTYPSESSLLLHIQYFRKFTEWFYCNSFLIFIDISDGIGLFLVSPLGAKTAAASRMALYCCLLSYLPAYMYNLLMFSRHLCSYKALLRDTTVILEEGNGPYPRCPRCNMFVPHKFLNFQHLTPAFYHMGEEKKRCCLE